MAKRSVGELASAGKRRIEWADRDMPVLSAIRGRFRKERPLKGKVIGACLHVTAETANLVRTLKEGGAEVYLCASNPLSSRDDVTAALNEIYGIPTHAKANADRKTFFAHIEAVLERQPNFTMDDGADLVTMLHTKYPRLLSRVIGGTEETTTGVVRLRAMARDGVLKYPIVAVNDARTKNLFDNRYGTGQSTLDGVIRATDCLIAGKTFVVAGYGWCGKGLAKRAQGLGANVIVTEIDAVKALEAAMDGFRVMPMNEAAALGDVFCTVTGNKDVIGASHFKAMKDGAIVCNAGHFDVEVNVKELKGIAAKVTRSVRPHVDEYMIRPSTSLGAKRIYLLAEGRLVNLAAAEGHPASVMDMSFSTQALVIEWLCQGEALTAGVHEVPDEIEEAVASAKLATMKIGIDTLTAEQKKYLGAWEEGT